MIRCSPAIPVALLLAGCASTATTKGSPTQPAGATPTGSGCVSETTARQIWTTIDTRLNAVVLDPQHAGLADVATGPALVDIRAYIARQLVANHVTEREVDRLDSLTVNNPACTGNVLSITVRITTTTDDYLRPDGALDHSDPLVGTSLHLLETFDRVPGGWKESSTSNLDTPATPGPLI